MREGDGALSYKSIEIHYRLSAIPGQAARDMKAALKFRNAAMGRIEAALAAAGAGRWAGAEIGTGRRTGEPEVNFGFEVFDLDRAEAIARAAVAGTPYDCIGKITRFDEAAFA